MLTKKVFIPLATGLIAAPVARASSVGFETLASIAKYQNNGIRKVQEATECNICGEGNSITIPDGEIADPQNGITLLCSEAGAVVEDTFCPFAPGLAAEPCGCVGPDNAPVVTPDCNICGEGNVITIPDGVISIPGADAALTCQTLQDEGGTLIPANFCPSITFLTSEACGCEPAEVETPSTPDPLPAVSDAPSPLPVPETTTDAPTMDDSGSASQYGSVLLSMCAIAGLALTM